MTNKYFIILLLAAIVGFSFARSINATPHANSPTQVLQRITIPQTHYEVGMGIGEMASNSTKGRRIQSGPEMVYVLEGELIYIVARQPRKIKAGESFQIQAGVPHETKAGPEGAKFFTTWVIEQGEENHFVVPIK